MFPFKNPTEDEKMVKEQDKQRDLRIKKASRLKKLSLKPGSGWGDFINIVREYRDFIANQKQRYNLSNCDEKTIRKIINNDLEISVLDWVLSVPEQYISELEAELKAIREEQREATNAE